MPQASVPDLDNRDECPSGSRASDAAQLPFELHVLIMNALDFSDTDGALHHYKHAMASMSLVCSAWKDECQKRLFRIIVYNGIREPGTNAGRTRMLWHDLLRDGDPQAHRLAAHVHNCAFGYGLWTASPDDDTFRFIVLSAMQHFRNLKELTLRHVNMDTDLIITMLNVPSLRSVSAEGCGFPVCASEELQLPTALRGRWTSLSIERTYIPPPWFGLLRNVTDVENLEHLSSDDSSVWSALLCHSVAPRLTDLRITVDIAQWYPHELAVVLENAPGLLRFSAFVNMGSTASGRHESFSQYAAPVLQELKTTRAELAVWLLPGRPVSSLTIVTSGDVGAEELLNAAKASTAAIEELTIPVDLLHILKQEDWPALRTLTVLPDMMRNVQSLPIPVCSHQWGFRCFLNLHHPEQYTFTKLSPLNTVMAFTYDLSSDYSRHRIHLLQLQLQRRELIDKLALAYPKAMRFRFGQVIEWRRDREGLGEWRPYALSQPLLLELCRTTGSYDETQDVDGFLAVFREAGRYLDCWRVV